MKIALFSPLLNEHSEIANHTERLREELEKRFEVRYLAEQPDGFLEPATGTHYPAALGHCPHELLLSLNKVDMPVYNLGNNPQFFSKTWFLCQYKPGIMVLHDLKLHHFFEGIYRAQLGDHAAYLSLMGEYYGDVGYDAGEAYWRGELPITFMAEHFPMTAWAVRSALGILVHTPHALDVIKKETRTPARMARLPYAPVAPLRAGADTVRGFSSERRAKLIIFGYLNANRRVVELLQALAEMPERGCFAVHIYGVVFLHREVDEAVETLGLAGNVVLHGYVSDEQLELGLAQADLAVNLRYPTMGEASASQLRIWEHALPSLVTYSEGYTSLPPDTVFFVRPEVEKADIQRHLRHFLVRPEFFREKGMRARQWLVEQHQAAGYVQELRALCEQAPELRSRYNELTLARRVGEIVSPWLNAVPAIGPERSYAARIAETV